MKKNNRFKFRAVITVEYGGEGADEKSATLLINNVAPQSDGNMCGFDIDELDKALDRAGIDDDIDIDQIRDYLYENSWYSDSDDYFAVDVDYIEQCTGVKDKSGKMIFEGDVVDYFGEPATIVWDCCGFKIKTNDDICHEFYRNGIEIIDNVHKTGIEIIGNIHEQKDI